MSTPTHHLDLVGTLADNIRLVGAAETLAVLRDERPAIHDGEYHDTRAVFFVWAVDRLLAAGLTPTALLWHPLVHADSPLAWWSADVLESPVATHGFVAPTGLLPGEPMPCEPAAALVAA